MHTVEDLYKKEKKKKVLDFKISNICDQRFQIPVLKFEFTILKKNAPNWNKCGFAPKFYLLDRILSTSNLCCLSLIVTHVIQRH